MGHATKMEDAGDGYAKVGGKVFFHGEAVASVNDYNSTGAVKSLGGGYATVVDAGYSGGKVLYMGKEVARQASKFEHLNGDWSKIHNNENGNNEFIYHGQRMTALDAYQAGCPGIDHRGNLQATFEPGGKLSIGRFTLSRMRPSAYQLEEARTRRARVR